MMASHHSRWLADRHSCMATGWTEECIVYHADSATNDLTLGECLRRQEVLDAGE